MVLVEGTSGHLKDNLNTSIKQGNIIQIREIYGKSDSEFMDATHMEKKVPKTQEIVEYAK